MPLPVLAVIVALLHLCQRKSHIVALYTVQVGALDGNVEEMLDLNGIVQSFRFLWPVHSSSRHDLIAGSPAYRTGYFIARFLARTAALILVAGLLIVLLVTAIKASKSG